MNINIQEELISRRYSDKFKSDAPDQFIEETSIFGIHSIINL